jgi:hypothetical protein
MKTIRIYDKQTKVWEYTLTSEEVKKGTRYVLSYSEAEHWTYPGEEILSVIDTGNDFKFEKAIGKTLQSDELVELQLLLTLIRLIDSNLSPMYEFVNANDVKEI